MSKPVLFIVPGYWEGVAAFEPLASALRKLDHEVHIAPRPSTDLEPSANPSPSQEADKQAIRDALLPLVDAGKQVIMVPHSAGGFLGGEAMKDLDIKTRQQHNQAGGVQAFIFLSAATWPEGTVHGELPFAHLDEHGDMHCNTPETTLFNDFSEVQLKVWLPRMRPQPKGSWTGETKFVGWKDLPSVYIVFEDDALIVPDLAEKLAGWSGSRLVRGQRGGHMAQISQAESLAGLIDKTAREFEVKS